MHAEERPVRPPVINHLVLKSTPIVEQKLNRVSLSSIPKQLSPATPILVVHELRACPVLRFSTACRPKTSHSDAVELSRIDTCAYAKNSHARTQPSEFWEALNRDIPEGPSGEAGIEILIYVGESGRLIRGVCSSLGLRSCFGFEFAGHEHLARDIPMIVSV